MRPRAIHACGGAQTTTPTKRRRRVLRFVGQPGLEDSGRPRSDEHPSTSAPDASAMTPVTARSPVDASASGPAIGPMAAVDLAFARALSVAVDAGRLDLVSTVTEKLRARRLAASSNVVELPTRDVANHDASRWFQ